MQCRRHYKRQKCPLRGKGKPSECPSRAHHEMLFHIQPDWVATSMGLRLSELPRKTHEPRGFERDRLRHGSLRLAYSPLCR